MRKQIVRPTQPAMSENDRLAHEEGSYVRRTVAPEPVELPPLPVDSDPSAVTPARTLTSYARRDVRNTMSRVKGW